MCKDEKSLDDLLEKDRASEEDKKNGVVTEEREEWNGKKLEEEDLDEEDKWQG